MGTRLDPVWGVIFRVMNGRFDLKVFVYKPLIKSAPRAACLWLTTSVFGRRTDGQRDGRDDVDDAWGADDDAMRDDDAARWGWTANGGVAER